MNTIQQELEEKLINEIENDCLENFKKYIGNCFGINHTLRSRHRVWETNSLPMLGKR
jgi:hypothetical protein